MPSTDDSIDKIQPSETRVPVVLMAPTEVLGRGSSFMIKANITNEIKLWRSIIVLY